MTLSPRDLECPIVQAPLGGGPPTPALAAAVSNAGGLGFLAAGYKTADAAAADIAEVRSLTDRPFGVNIFAPPGAGDGGAAARAYAETLAGEAERYGAAAGEPRHDDDGWEAKLELVARERVPAISLTFGCPPATTIERLHEAGAAVWVTVTTVGEAVTAREAGA